MILFAIAAGLIASTAAAPQDHYRIELALTLKSYNAGDNHDFYQCDSSSSSKCGYQLQVDVASDGVTVGHVLSDRRVYSGELSFGPSQEPGFRNPVRFNLTRYPHNLTITVTMHYYSSSGQSVARVFRTTLGRIPLTNIPDEVPETVRSDGWSSFLFNAQLACREHRYGYYCEKFCRTENPEHRCSPDGALLCRNSGQMPSCDTSTKTADKTPTTVIEKLRPDPPAKVPIVNGEASTPAPGSLGIVRESGYEHLILPLVLCSGVLILVAALSGFSVLCVSKLRKRHDRRRGQPRGIQNSQDAVIFAKAGQSSVDVYFGDDEIYRPRQQPPLPSSSGSEVIAYDSQQAQLDNQLFPARRGSCSGSSNLCGSAGALEASRYADGQEFPPYTGAAVGHQAYGTLPDIQPPGPFGTDTARSVSRFGTGRNGRQCWAIEC